MTGQEFVQENDASRQEMAALIADLDERSLALAVGSGWTVSSLLGHLAFWDQRVCYLLEYWRAAGFEPSSLGGLTVDSINQAVKALAQAIPGGAAARLAMESAAAADAQAAQASDELAQQILDAGLTWVLQRYAHRREHLRQMRQALESRR